MGRRLVLEDDLSPAQELAETIITGQAKAIGDLAVVLANQVSGLVINSDAPPQLLGDEIAVIDALVREYSAVSGVVGPRLCFMAAEPVLRRHPHLQIPAFAGLEVSVLIDAGGKRKRFLGVL